MSKVYALVLSIEPLILRPLRYNIKSFYTAVLQTPVPKTAHQVLSPTPTLGIHESVCAFPVVHFLPPIFLISFIAEDLSRVSFAGCSFLFLFFLSAKVRRRFPNEPSIGSTYANISHSVLYPALPPTVQPGGFFFLFLVLIL